MHRQSIPAYKGEDNNWYVLVDQVEREEPEEETEPEVASPPPPPLSTPSVVYDQYIASLQQEVSFLRSELETRSEELAQRTEELRRRDVMMMKLAERPLEIPANVPSNGTHPEPQGPWWKRWFNIS